MQRSLLFVLVLGVAAPALAQSPAIVPSPVKTVSLAGPRFGVTFLDPGVVARLAERNVLVKPTISQYGWQLEKQFYSRDSGAAVISEWVFLLGGLDQGVTIPSASWLVGLRSRDGAEIGMGPNITPGGVALALAGGVTMRAGGFNVPLNVAVVPSKYGKRISVMTGFSLRRR